MLFIFSAEFEIFDHLRSIFKSRIIWCQISNFRVFGVKFQITRKVIKFRTKIDVSKFLEKFLGL